MASEEGGLWLFGYGSLIWKPPPHYDKRVPGYIEGYVRRFWQDHRGTPDAPGRVVTLINREHWESLTDQHPTAPPKVWGAAYHIPANKVEEVKEYLDIREINGYTVDMVSLHVPVHIPSIQSQIMSTSRITPESGNAVSEENHSITCLVYIGLPDNPQFVGPQDPQQLAEHIVKSRGPSGENTEYVYNLAEALDKLRQESGLADGVDVDDHVADLAERVRLVEKGQKDKGAGI